MNESVIVEKINYIHFEQLSQVSWNFPSAPGFTSVKLCVCLQSSSF